MEITSRRRSALSTALAILLAVESVSAVAAAAQVNASRRSAQADVAATAPQSVAVEAVAAAPGAMSGSSAIAGAGVADFHLPDAVPAEPAGVPAAPDRPQEPRAPVANVAKATTTTKTTKAAKATKEAKSSPASFRGRNHVWIPSLGINRSVHWFSCDRQREPDNYVYRWGCAGGNNVYLMGHAHSVFNSLHDAYVSGRLRKGMKAYYADAKGRVRVYAVRWWKVTAPTTAASWAWASLGTPSMTLQTCVGKNSQYRLMVRLVEVNG